MLKPILFALIAIVGGLALVASTEAKRPVHAGPPVQYAFTLDQAEPVAAGTEVSFTVTRSDSSRDVMWVTLDCDGDGDTLNDPDAVVAWGQFDSLEGHTTGQVLTAFGSECTAYLTKTPWNPKPNDPSITFVVT